MNVLVIGGTGFTGKFVVRQLLAAGHTVRCLVRPTSDTSGLPTDKIHLVQGDMGNATELAQALDGMDALVYVASLGFGHAQGVVDTLQASHIKRAVFVSTTALFTQLNASSKVVRVAAEKSITDSALDYTILRPTMIYGTPNDRNMIRLIRFIQRTPIIPIFGDGQSLQQPVYVADVAAAIVAALPNTVTYRKAYNISGAAPLTYNEVIDEVANGLGKRIIKLHIPYKPVVWVLQQIEKLGITLPIKAEQILRLNENKAFEHAEASRDFGYTPKDFASGVRLELEELKQIAKG